VVIIGVLLRRLYISILGGPVWRRRRRSRSDCAIFRSRVTPCAWRQTRPITREFARHL